MNVRTKFHNHATVVKLETSAAAGCRGKSGDPQSLSDMFCRDHVGLHLFSLCLPDMMLPCS